MQALGHDGVSEDGLWSIVGESLRKGHCERGKRQRKDCGGSQTCSVESTVSREHESRMMARMRTMQKQQEYVTFRDSSL